jgi:hypothetical protein
LISVLMTTPKNDPARAALIPVTLVLRPAEGDRADHRSAYDYYDVLDDGREVGRIYRINPATEIWWWDVWFQPTGRKSYGDADARERVLAAFRAVCDPWLKQPPRSSTSRRGP